MNEAVIKAKCLELAVSVINNTPKKEGQILDAVPIAEGYYKFLTTISPIKTL